MNAARIKEISDKNISADFFKLADVRCADEFFDFVPEFFAKIDAMCKRGKVDVFFLPKMIKKVKMPNTSEAKKFKLAKKISSAIIEDEISAPIEFSDVRKVVYEVLAHGKKGYEVIYTEMREKGCTQHIEFLLAKNRASHGRVTLVDEKHRYLTSRPEMVRWQDDVKRILNPMRKMFGKHPINPSIVMFSAPISLPALMLVARKIDTSTPAMKVYNDAIRYMARCEHIEALNPAMWNSKMYTLPALEMDADISCEIFAYFDKLASAYKISAPACTVQAMHDEFINGCEAPKKLAGAGEIIFGFNADFIRAGYNGDDAKYLADFENFIYNYQSAKMISKPGRKNQKKMRIDEIVRASTMLNPAKKRTSSKKHAKKRK